AGMVCIATVAFFLYAYRVWVSYGIEAATRATPADLRAIETAAEVCREGHLTGNPDLFDRGDDEFHLGIAKASQNPFLVEAVREIRRLQRQSSIIGLHGTVGGHAEEAVVEHAAIHRAIRDGDPEAAAEAATVHLDKTLEDYRREIRRRVFG
ncbi:FCD domain-containing protein, partial [Streptomyces sp. NPDC048106]|uniref:FadR/GntR family transcriptional regulator n=1 Tax=Streptomyces sp. NPDC048106 TaxID=3155750 RepID=UPI00345348F1